MSRPLCALAPPCPHLVRLHPEHLGNANAQLLRLNDRIDEPAQLLHTYPVGHLRKRIAAQLAHGHLTQHPRQLHGQRTAALLSHPRQGCVQAQACFHTCGDQVQRIRKRPQHLLLTDLYPALQPLARDHPSHDSEYQHDNRLLEPHRTQHHDDGDQY